jgi:hypothetical protein
VLAAEDRFQKINVRWQDKTQKSAWKESRSEI